MDKDMLDESYLCSISDNDRIKLLEQFPEEVWLMILNKPWGYEELDSLCNSSTFFRYLLSQQKACTVQEKVIEGEMTLPANNFIKLCNTLGYMHKLEYLKIINADLRLRKNKNWQSDLVFIYPNCYVPKLEKLSKLTVSNMSSVLLDLFLLTNDFITELTVILPLSPIHLGYTFFHLPLTNLTTLRLENCGYVELVSLCLDVVPWKLEKIALVFSPNDLIGWSLIFIKLGQKFSDTLTDVMVELPRPLGVENDIANIFDMFARPSKLEHIKRLRLVADKFTNFNFVLPMKDTLEYLEIVLGVHFENGEACRISESVSQDLAQLLGYPESFLNFGIFEDFPNLKRLCITKIFADGSLVKWSPTREAWIEENGKSKVKPVHRV